MRCLNCGYLLRGLADNRCPECNRPFDPRNPTSFERVSRVTVWWLLPFLAAYGGFNIACVGPWTYPHEGTGVFGLFTIAPFAIAGVLVVIHFVGLRFSRTALVVLGLFTGIAFLLNARILLRAFADV